MTPMARYRRPKPRSGTVRGGFRAPDKSELPSYTMTPSSVDAIEVEIQEEMAKCYYDPLRFVLFAYDWGKGPLEGLHGPDRWQKDFLIELGKEVEARKF